MTKLIDAPESRKVDRYFAARLPVDYDIVPSRRKYLSARIAGAILSAGASEKLSAGIQVTVLVDAIGSLRASAKHTELDTRRRILLAEAQIEALGGRDAMIASPPIAHLRVQLRRRERDVYLVGLIARAVFLLQKFKAPSWSLENAREFIEDTYTSVSLFRSEDEGDELHLGRLGDETMRAKWTRYRKLAAYCFVAFNHQVPLTPLLDSEGYASVAAFACQAKRVQLHLEKALTAHAPGRNAPDSADGERRRHYAKNQLLPFNQARVGTDEGKRLRAAVREVLIPTAAEAQAIQKLKGMRHSA